MKPPNPDRLLQLVSGTTDGPPSSNSASTPASPEIDVLDAYSQAVTGVVETVGPAVVNVARTGKGQAGMGSAFLIAPDGYALTNSHVAHESPRLIAITREGDYLGGAITAGVNLAAEALYTHAAKLPRIDLQRPPSVIGRNTVHAMQSGLLFGYVSMVEGMVARFRAELGDDMKVVATGGLAEVVAKETPVIQHIAPWLTLDGLRILWELNR